MPETINPDAFLEAEHGRVWTPERNIEAWQCAFSALEAALRRDGVSRFIVVCGLQGAGKSTWIGCRSDDEGTVYFDAALPAAKHRKPLIDIARRCEVTIEAVWIKVSLSLALERNRLRNRDEIVPEESIRSVAARFEPPSTDEGFTKVTINE